MRVRRGRPTVAVIDRGALRTNLGEIRKLISRDAAICEVIKADGYGHGAKEVARLLEKEGASRFAVATVEEGVEVREAGMVHPEVLVLGGFVADEEILVDEVAEWAGSITYEVLTGVSQRVHRMYCN